MVYRKCNYGAMACHVSEPCGTEKIGLDTYVGIGVKSTHRSIKRVGEV